jgi:hypothetical protein
VQKWNLSECRVTKRSVKTQIRVLAALKKKTKCGKSDKLWTFDFDFIGNREGSLIKKERSVSFLPKENLDQVWICVGHSQGHNLFRIFSAYSGLSCGNEFRYTCSVNNGKQLV